MAPFDSKFQKAMDEMNRKLSTASRVMVGFFENATYPDGTPVAMVAAVQEYGATIDIDAGETTVYRSIDKDGEFLKGGKFVEKAKANFATTHTVPTHTVRIPARPFFRNGIAKYSKEWPGLIARKLKQFDYDAQRTLEAVGDVVIGEFKQSIKDTNEPPLAPSTVRAKGFDKPLIDTAVMINSVDKDVT